jgi:hypothetical protein
MKLLALVSRRFVVPLVLLVVSPFTATAEEPALIEFKALGIAGSFEVIIDESTQQILEITSISLMINNHKYKIRDVEFGFFDSGGTEYIFIGGEKNGGDTVRSGTRDFSLIWNPAVSGAYFSYSQPGMKVAASDFASDFAVKP